MAGQLKDSFQGMSIFFGLEYAQLDTNIKSSYASFQKTNKQAHTALFSQHSKSLLRRSSTNQFAKNSTLNVVVEQFEV